MRIFVPCAGALCQHDSSVACGPMRSDETPAFLRKSHAAKTSAAADLKAAQIARDEEHVLVLNAATIQDAIERAPLLLVEFYAVRYAFLLRRPFVLSLRTPMPKLC